MKKIILNIFSLLALGVVVNAQVGLGVETNGTVRNGAILDFPESATKGILLPRVDNAENVDKISGTLLYDKEKKKVLFYGYDKSVGSGKWVELTVDANNSPLEENFNPSDAKEMSNGVLIEDGTSESGAPEGVLTLESKDRALVLPSVEDATKIPSPKAGLICYDKKSKSLAIFNGEKWYFWK